MNPTPTSKPLNERDDAAGKRDDRLDEGQRRVLNE